MLHIIVEDFHESFEVFRALTFLRSELILFVGMILRIKTPLLYAWDMRFIFVDSLIVGFVSTGLMTMFSYVWSSIRKKKFSEPELLNDLLERLNVVQMSGPLRLTGWLIHYLVGVFFIVLYQIYWNAADTEPTSVNGIVLGAINGIIGMYGWKLTFFLHRDPPLIDFKEYYLQLFFAHVVFGLTAATTFSLITDAPTRDFFSMR